MGTGLLCARKRKSFVCSFVKMSIFLVEMCTLKKEESLTIGYPSRVRLQSTVRKRGPDDFVHRANNSLHLGPYFSSSLFLYMENRTRGARELTRAPSFVMSSNSLLFWFCFLPVCVCSCDIPVFCGRPPSLIQHLPLSFRKKNLCIIFSLFSFNCRTSMLLYTQTSRGNMYKSEKGRNQPKVDNPPYSTANKNKS